MKRKICNLRFVIRDICFVIFNLCFVIRDLGFMIRDLGFMIYALDFDFSAPLQPVIRYVSRYKHVTYTIDTRYIHVT